MSGYDNSFINDNSLREPFYPGGRGESCENGYIRKRVVSTKAIIDDSNKKQDHWDSIFSNVVNKEYRPGQLREIKKG
jgi:hypothetical protein